MDNKRKSGYGRGGYNTKTEYDRRLSGGGFAPPRPSGTRRVTSARFGGASAARDARQTSDEHRGLTEADRLRRYERGRKKKRQRSARIKAAVIVTAVAAVAVVLFFMTPIFNITQINLEGAKIVEKNAVRDKIGYVVGKNLFSVRNQTIREQLKEIPQISDARVKKSFFPSMLTVTIYESSPAAYLLSGSAVVIIDSELRVIDDSGVYGTEGIPSLSGISVSSYKVNETLSGDSDEKDSILKTLLTGFESEGLLSRITYISLDDLADIKFNYDNRIEAKCGSQLELGRKIRMFAEAMKSSSMSDNAIGSMDLSTPGRAVYNSLSQTVRDEPDDAADETEKGDETDKKN